MADYQEMLKAAGLMVGGWVIGVGVLCFWSTIGKVWHRIKNLRGIR